MKRSSGAITALAVSLISLSSCQKPTDSVKSDLQEAGYKLTTEDWFRACRGNDVAVLKKFVAGKFSVDARNAEGDTALHAAAAAGARATADFLLNRGMAIDVRGAADRTPLMAAVLAGKTEMVRWLLRQGADPRLKDKDGYKPLMLAVREGKAGAVGELAPYDRSELDSALLLAALVGRTDVIDALTNFGASVYARMEDGRTPLMVAAENGNADAVKLLLDIGASRYTTNPDGRTAEDIAMTAGHTEIAAIIAKQPEPDDLSLDSPESIGKSMDAYVDRALAKAEPDESAEFQRTAKPMSHHPPAALLDGVTMGKPSTSAPPPAPVGDPAQPSAAAADFPISLVMRHYREKEVPVRVRTVQGDVATVHVGGISGREVKVRAGDSIPGSRLVVVRVQRRMEDSKVNMGTASEISIVEVRDNSTGATRRWMAGVPPQAHDPVALVEDAATGQRYVASPGQHFKAPDGSDYLVSEVRPNQLVIQNVATGEVRTIPLRGPRG